MHWTEHRVPNGGVRETFKIGSMGITLGVLVQAVFFVIMFLIKFVKRLRLSGNQLKKLIMAVIVALAGALIILLIYQLAGDKLSAGVAIAVSAIPGVLLYLAAVTFLRIVSDKEAEQMPGGELFLRLNELLHR